MRLQFSAAAIVFFLGACASTGTAKSERSASKPESQSSGARSAIGTIASNAGAGALYGAQFTAEAGRDCRDSLCGAFSLVMGAVLIPAGAVIGAVVGVVKVAAANQGNETANASGGTCPDPRVAGWLRECRKLQGPIPVAGTVSEEGPEGDTQPDPAFGAWFDACGAALERKWDSLERTRVPAICESEPVPSWWRVECIRKSAAVKKDREFNRALFESERSRFERNAPSEHCSS